VAFQAVLLQQGEHVFLKESVLGLRLPRRIEFLRGQCGKASRGPKNGNRGKQRSDSGSESKRHQADLRDRWVGGAGGAERRRNAHFLRGPYPRQTGGFAAAECRKKKPLMNLMNTARQSRNQRESNTAQIPLSQPEEETADER
jgi:hypothetical protein